MSLEHRRGRTIDHEEEIRRIETAISVEMAERTHAVFAPDHRARGYRAPVVDRDLAYGPDPRHRLDVHRSGDAGEAAPVLVYVHGGGFVGGDKNVPDMPYYDHVGAWAAERGLVGVTMTYRLAPDHTWPAGGEDVAAAVGWLRKQVGEYGGDPDRIVPVGHSAGAVHVATFLAAAGPSGPEGVAGAALLSGIYDLEAAEPGPPLTFYIGDDPAEYAARSPLPGLLESPVPLLFSIAELDPPDFQGQAAGLVAAWNARHGTVPQLVWVGGHNHVSEVLSLSVDDDALGVPLLRFIRHVTG